jgi:hypothetical protein
MNPGTQGPTIGVQEQQSIAMQQLQDFWKTQIPALNYVIRTSKADEPGIETMAAGSAAARGKAIGAADARAGAVSTKGTVVGNVGKGLSMGANDAAVGAPEARPGARGLYDQTRLGVIGQGNKILDMANKGLETAAGISQGEAAAAQQKSAAEQQALLNAALASLALA